MDSFEMLMEHEFKEQRKLKATYVEMILDCYEKFGDLSLYLIQDLINSYDKLILQRNECIAKYLKVLELMKDDDEVNIIKPMQSLIEKKHNDVAEWEQEIAPLVELLEIGENGTDEQVNAIVEKLQSI